MDALPSLALPAVRPAAPCHEAGTLVRPSPPSARTAVAAQLPVLVVAALGGAVAWFNVAAWIGFDRGEAGESLGVAGLIALAFAGLIAGCAARARDMPAPGPRVAALRRFLADGLDTPTGRVPAGAVLVQILAMPLLLAALTSALAIAWRRAAG
jgi:hypothetical protein